MVLPWLLGWRVRSRDGSALALSIAGSMAPQGGDPMSCSLDGSPVCQPFPSASRAGEPECPMSMGTRHSLPAAAAALAALGAVPHCFLEQE